MGQGQEPVSTPPIVAPTTKKTNGVDWSTIFNSPTGAAIVQSAGQLGGAALAGKGAEKQAKWLEAQRQLESARERGRDLEDRGFTNANSVFAGRQAQQDEADQTVLGAMGSSPLQFQQERAKMSGLADALAGGGPANLAPHMAAFARPGFWTEDKLKFMRPSAEAEKPYWDAVGVASKGRFSGPNLGAIYGDEDAKAVDESVGALTAASGQQWDQEWEEHESVLQNLMDEARANNDQEKMAALQQIQAEEKEKPSGGGFWKKLAKIGIIAGAGIATAMTGGAAAPLIGIAAGAGSGAIDGGWKGALLGGGMGALSGGLGGIGGAGAGAASSAAKQGLGAALKTTFSNPANLIGMGGAAIGGAGGQLAGDVARMVPGLNRPLAGPQAARNQPLASRSLAGLNLDASGAGPLPSSSQIGWAPDLPSAGAGNMAPGGSMAPIQKALSAAISSRNPKAVGLGAGKPGATFDSRPPSAFPATSGGFMPPSAAVTGPAAQQMWANSAAAAAQNTAGLPMPPARALPPMWNNGLPYNVTNPAVPGGRR